MLKLTIVNLIIAIVLTTLMIGCGPDESEVDTLPKLQISFPKPFDPDVPSRIVVHVSAPDRELPPQEFPINKAIDEMLIDIRMPIDAHRISVEVFDFDGNVVFNGSREISLISGEPTIDIRLDPMVPIVEFIASHALIELDQEFRVGIELKNIEDLFAVSLEIEFDENFLEVIDVKAGKIWGKDTLIISDHDLPRRDFGRVNVAIAKVGDRKLEPSGEILNLTFRAIRTGKAKVRLIGNNRLSIQNMDGTPIDGYESIFEYLTRAEIAVEIR